MALLKKMAADLARLFPGEVHIEETHHERKKDAPSGSALSLAEAIEKVRPGKESGYYFGSFGRSGRRACTQVHGG